MEPPGYLLDDLTTERAEALMARPGPPLARLAFLVLRYGRTEELARRLPDWTALFAELETDPSGREDLVVLVRYLLQVGDKATREATDGVLRSVMDARRAEELMKTVGEELIEHGLQLGMAKGMVEGRAKGLVEGRAEGLSKAVLRVLTARGVGIDDKARHRILSCTDLATLDGWLERALNATTVADILGDLSQ